jgi:hypothetical protein
MPEAVEIQVLQDSKGVSVYRVAVGVGRGLSVVRDFKSKKDAERFAGRRRSNEGPKHA